MQPTDFTRVSLETVDYKIVCKWIGEWSGDESRRDFTVTDYDNRIVFRSWLPWNHDEKMKAEEAKAKCEKHVRWKLSRLETVKIPEQPVQNIEEPENPMGFQKRMKEIYEVAVGFKDIKSEKTEKIYEVVALEFDSWIPRVVVNYDYDPEHKCYTKREEYVNGSFVFREFSKRGYRESKLSKAMNEQFHFLFKEDVKNWKFKMMNKSGVMEEFKPNVNDM